MNKAFERKLASGNKKQKQPPKTRSNSAGIKRPAMDPLVHSSSEDEETVPRPNKNKAYAMSKEDFLEKMTLLNHPILQDPDQLELTYRYIDLANSMLRRSGTKLAELAHMEGEELSAPKPANRREGPYFFRGDMSTTIMVNGVDQIVRRRGAKGWSHALTDIFWEARVMVKDFWVVKKQGEAVVSVLVQTASRYQKILAIAAVNEARDKVAEQLGRAQCRVNVRDAFPKDQLEMVQEAYNRGYHLKKAGKIQAYRIYNQGGDEPVFEVRTAANGKTTWGPAPPPTGDTPPLKGRASRRQDREKQPEDMEVLESTSGQQEKDGEATETAFENSC
jgi:hypothetical protein